MIILIFLFQIAIAKLIAPRKVISALDSGSYIETRTA